MNYLKLKSLKLNNIRCYSNITLDFKDGTNIITGENGSGKSTILLSIGFALYGVKYLVNSGIEQNDLIRRGHTSGSIMLKYETAMGNYEIRYKLEETGSNEWHLRDDKGRILSKTISDTRTLVQNSLGINVDSTVFKNALCSSQGELTTLLEAKPYERKNQLHKILGINSYANTLKHVSKIISKIDDKRERLQDRCKNLSSDIRNFGGLEVEIQKLQKETEDAENTLIDINLGLRSVVKGIETLNDMKLELQLLDGKITDNNNLLKNNTEKIKLIEKSILSDQASVGIDAKTKEDVINHSKIVETETIQLNGELKKVRDQLTRLSSWQEQIEFEQDRIKDLQKSLNFQAKSLNEVLGGSSRDKILTEFKSVSEFINELELQEGLYLERMKQIENQIKSMQDKKEDYENRINKFDNKLKKYTNKGITELSEVIAKCSGDLEEQKSIHSSLVKQRDQIKQSLGEIKSEIKLHSNTIDILNNLEKNSDCPTCLQDLKQTNVEELYELHQNKVTQLEIKQKELLNDDLMKEKEIEDSSILVDSLDSRLIQLNELNANLNDRIEMGVRLKSISTEIEKCTVDKANLKKSRVTLKKLTSAKEQANELQIKIDKIESITKTEAKLKGQLSSSIESRDDLRSKMGDANIKEAKILEMQLTDKHNKLSNQLKIYISKLIPNYQECEELNTQITKIINKITSDKLRKKDLEKVFDEEKLDRMVERKGGLLEKKGGLRSFVDNAKDRMLPEKIRQLDLIREKQTELEYIIGELNSVDLALPKVNKIKQVLAELPNKIMDNITDMVSTQLTQTVHRMLPNRGFQEVIFSNDGEVNLSYNGKLIDRKTLSGGEKTVIGIGLRLALAEYVAPMRFLILDEPTANLDNDRVNEFVETIDRGSLFSNNGQMLIVTHREEFNRNASRTIRIDIKGSGERNLVIDEAS